MDSEPTLASEAQAGGELALVALLRAGDAGAFEELVRTHTGRLLAAARRLLRNEDDAREAVQEGFLSAWKSLARFHGDCRIGTWLHRIVLNAGLMRLRARGARPETSIEGLLPQFVDDGHRLEPQAPWSDRAEAQALQQEDRRAVRNAIDKLPETYRTVLMLRDIEELDTKTTAELLGVTENAVKIRLHRARQALRTLLEQRFGVTA